MKKNYDVIVVGGGHAGCEASLAASRMGLNVLLITMKKTAIGYTSCNPSIGGIGKGQLVKEIDALGGEMAKCTDASMIQYRMLNSSKGYAARSSRAQIDRKLYNEYMYNCIIQENGLDVHEDEVTKITVNGNRCTGVETKEGLFIKSSKVILTTGTYMNGTIHIGMEHFPGGRIGEDSSTGLSDNLKELGFNVGTLKTGTPARIDGESINYSLLEAQYGDQEIIPFSYSTKEIKLPQKPCYITRTNKRTHEIITKGLDRSPLYTGKIKSTGVRYCPSIEDKIVRFPDRDSHLIFLEPEGLDTTLYYPNGISTSLPAEVQEEMVHSIQGLENAKIEQFAYGIEYDFVDPTQLFPTMESKLVQGLYLAGQINGTTGYEEAAALGFMAGVNAAQKIKKDDQLVLERSRSYIGVLIDDLVTKGTREPYRMFTSRVEYRIIVREDNADMRLSEIGYNLGLIPEGNLNDVREKMDNVKMVRERLSEETVSPGSQADGILARNGEKPLTHKITMEQFLRRPSVAYHDIEELSGHGDKLPYYERVQLEVDIKYAGYIERELARIKKFKDLERIRIPKDFDYRDIPGLSAEIKEKLSAVVPISLGQASRISGVTPAAISILMVKLKAEKRKK